MSSGTNENAPTADQAYTLAFRELETLSLALRTPGVTPIPENADYSLRVVEQAISLGDSLLGQTALRSQLED